MKITAADADEPGNINSQIAYTIVDQQPPGDMFSISKDGIVRVKSSALDREVQCELHPQGLNRRELQILIYGARFVSIIIFVGTNVQKWPTLCVKNVNQHV